MSCRESNSRKSSEVKGAGAPGASGSNAHVVATGPDIHSFGVFKKEAMKNHQKGHGMDLIYSPKRVALGDL